MGTNDMRVIALDARTGAPCSGFGAGGEVKIDVGIRLAWPGEMSISSAPVVARGIVVVGSSIADNVRVEAPQGTVWGLDARTGQVRWTWDPLVHDGIDAGQANVWAPMSVDEDMGLVFLPTSSPGPDFWGGKRPGNNEHADSVVALRAETGELAWAFQTVHHNVWDYDLPAQPTLARIDTGAGQRDHVPTLVPQRISADDAFGLISHTTCHDKLAGARNEGLYTPPSAGGSLIFPMTGGGVNWGGAAFDPVNEILNANTSRGAQIVTPIPAAEARTLGPAQGHDFGPQRGAPFAITRDVVRSRLGLPCPPPWASFLRLT
jgi:quinoprotein glucose dehydrogenase